MEGCKEHGAESGGLERKEVGNRRAELGTLVNAILDAESAPERLTVLGKRARSWLRRNIQESVLLDCIKSYLME